MEQRYGGKGVVGRVLPPDDVRGATQIGLLRGEVNRDALRFVKHRVGWVPGGVGRREQEGAVAISILQSAMVLRLNKYANVRLNFRLTSHIHLVSVVNVHFRMLIHLPVLNQVHRFSRLCRSHGEERKESATSIPNPWGYTFSHAFQTMPMS